MTGTTNRNDIAIIDFKVDENGTPSINIDAEPQNGSSIDSEFDKLHINLAIFGFKTVGWNAGLSFGNLPL